jgi:DNA-binding IclR family transcriptional regulator
MSASKDQIIQVVRSNPGLSAGELARKVGMPSDYMASRLMTLMRAGRVNRRKGASSIRSRISGNWRYYIDERLL